MTMHRYLRTLPGPVWTMALWCAVYVVNRAVRCVRLGEPASAWIAEVAFEGVLLIVVLVWGARTPAWFLQAAVFAQLALAFAVMTQTRSATTVLAVATGSVIAVLYASVWWQGWLSYAAAAAGSASYLVAIHTGGHLDVLVDTWFALSTMLFGIALGMNLIVGRVEHQASHDALTGLPNRIGLEQFLALHPGAGRAMLPRALVIIDLDGFKRINDTEGHAVGDEVLREFAAALRAGLRPDDLAVRFGGDEFLLVLPQTDRAAAESLVARLRDASDVSWSCGIVDWEPHESFDHALVIADARMYQDKERDGEHRER